MAYVITIGENDKNGKLDGISIKIPKYVPLSLIDIVTYLNLMPLKDSVRIAVVLDRKHKYGEKCYSANPTHIQKFFIHNGHICIELMLENRIVVSRYLEWEITELIE